MSDFDPGPPASLAALLDDVPDPPVLDDFWFDWGPVFYRGRLDGRRACFASPLTPDRPSELSEAVISLRGTGAVSHSLPLRTRLGSGPAPGLCSSR